MPPRRVLQRLGGQAPVTALNNAKEAWLLGVAVQMASLALQCTPRKHSLLKESFPELYLKGDIKTLEIQKNLGK